MNRWPKLRAAFRFRQRRVLPFGVEMLNFDLTYRSPP